MVNTSWKYNNSRLPVDSVMFIPLSLYTQYKTASVIFGVHEMVTEFPSSKMTDAKDLVSISPRDMIDATEAHVYAYKMRSIIYCMLTYKNINDYNCTIKD